MEPRIISNKVYESLQVPTMNTRTTTGKVLYANQYSGIAKVAMPEDLKALIDSDFGLVGKNILIQLEQKMRGYSNGPWYVDSRDGVIYIHNRKFHEEPVTVYTYQGENGEVLRVSFSTQTVTKRVKVTMSPTVDPATKDFSMVSTQIDDKEKEEPTTPDDDILKATPYTARVDNTQVDNPGSNGFEDHRSHPTTNIAAEWAANNKLKDRAAEKAMVRRLNYVERMNEYDSVGPVGAYEAGVQRKLDSMSAKELITLAGQATDAFGKKAEVEAAIKISKGKDLEANLQTIFKNEKYLWDSQDGVEIPVVEYVDPMDYDPERYASKKLGAGIASGIDYQTGVLPASQRGLEAIKKDPYIEIEDPYFESTGKMESDTNKHYGQGQYGKKIRIKHMKKVKAQIPVYKIYSNLLSRYGGAEKFAWAANANANGGLKHTEKKLICQMQVVGRPMLASSQIIFIENVGKRWSGYWYIKKCTHQMDAGQGYVTNLELVKNGSKAGSITAKTDISTQTIVSNDAKSNAKTPMGKDKKPSSTIQNLDPQFTFNEIEYFKRNYFRVNTDTGEWGVANVRGLSEDLRKKCWYTEVNANDPVALAEGIVESSGNIVTSSGEVIPGKLTMKDIKVPDDYHIKFDVMKMTKVFLRESLKNRRK